MLSIIQKFWRRCQYILLFIVALWRIGSDGAQQAYHCGFKSHVRFFLQGELLQYCHSLVNFKQLTFGL